MPTMEMVKKRLQVISDLQDELRELKSQADDLLEDNAEYAEVKEQTDLIMEQVKEKKARVLEDPAYANATQKMGDIRTDIKDQQDALSQELVDLYKEEGITEIEDSNGDLKRLKFAVKLVSA